MFSEHEEFLTPEDFKTIGVDISDEELEKINGHPSGGLDRKNEFKNIEQNEIDDDMIRILPDGTKIYRPDDPGEMYKPKEVKKISLLLEQTPEKFRKEIMKGTVVQRVDYQGRFRRGFIQNEDSVAIRILNEKGRPVVKNNLTEYTALTEIRYGYRPKNSDNFISYVVKPGENFWSPRSGEKKRESK